MAEFGVTVPTIVPWVCCWAAVVSAVASTRRLIKNMERVIIDGLELCGAESARLGCVLDGFGRDRIGVVRLGSGPALDFGVYPQYLSAFRRS